MAKGNFEGKNVDLGQFTHFTNEQTEARTNSKNSK